MIEESSSIQGEKTNEASPNIAKTVLGFDFGTTRIGVAIGQNVTMSARPLSPLKANEGIPNWDTIAKLVAEWEPDCFVVGLPLNMDGSENEMCQRARKFAKRLHGRYNRPYHMMDERLSSYDAKGQVIAQGGHRNFKENSVDGLAAQLIIETWFAEQTNQ
ncbi:Holliday junction resolvase RuvX [Marinomonas mediterranea]|jgi:RNAse H-fold protein YqgF|uniref:Putative pre-16S rRNA nuclease n=1 Tax=Marinomonas mediterranea (strain ATCC 700492 / JCM 21426 / NBRC 103028 / MMB-1) TaxID=717774 RepID=F2JW27_MARM1|nr:Holliday junction resolvase RuvX [Marinomonas mediterranea]ADZ92915.1 Holliday junction resolvase [Marinomonas mediterranea MMB-1]WCN18939.1 Holliday junction resolvase RuvX [Marinomonas mediterranea MMB-1]